MALPGEVTPPSEGPLYSDEFEGEAVSLDGRSVPIAAAPAVWSVTAATAWGTSGTGEVGPTAGATSNAWFDAGVSDGIVTAQATAILGAPAGSNNRRCDLLFRYVDGTNWWRVSARPSLGVFVWQLQKFVDGALSTRGPDGPLAAPGDAVEIVLDGDAITWKVNGVTIGTVNDTTHLSATRYGFRGQFSIDPTSRWGHITIAEA
jgi:hypothetical protein